MLDLKAFTEMVTKCSTKELDRMFCEEKERFSDEEREIIAKELNIRVAMMGEDPNGAR